MGRGSIRVLTIGAVCGNIKHTRVSSVMVGSKESVRSQCQDHFLNLEQRRDCEVSVHTTHTSRSHSRSRSHMSHGEDTKNT